MMNSKFLFPACISVALSLFLNTSSLSAQELLADKIHADQAAVLPEAVLAANLLDEEDDPAYEAYDDAWDNYRLNPYGTTIAQIPDSFVIDLSGFIPPVETYVTSNYGMRRRRMHKGIDLKVQVGDTVVAAFDGKIRIVRYERRGYGHYVVIRHNNGLETVYGHLSRPLVSINQPIKAGEAIGLGGNTGRSTGSHLHFETRFMGNAFNPATLIDFKNFITREEAFVVHNGRMKKTPSKFEAGISSYAQSIKESVEAPFKSVNKFYVVRKGDTLGRISQNTGITVSKLCKLNNISKTSLIRPGQKLKLT